MTQAVELLDNKAIKLYQQYLQDGDLPKSSKEFAALLSQDRLAALNKLRQKETNGTD